MGGCKFFMNNSCISCSQWDALAVYSAGAGGGYMERDKVEYVDRRENSDDEFDEVMVIS